MFNLKNFSIRPIKFDDKNLILQWRNSEHIRFNMYNDHIISQDEHDIWFSKTLVDTSVAYLIFQYNENPIGLIYFTKIDCFHSHCYWGFYLGERDVPRGVGSVMEFFAMDYAFSSIKIRKLCCEVFAFNESVIKLHEKFGFVREGRLVKHYLKKENYEDVICLAKFAETWTDEREIFNHRIFRSTEK